MMKSGITLLENSMLISKKASEIAGVANGNIIKALELYENEDSSFQNLERFKNLMRFAWKRDIISILSWSENISVNRQGGTEELPLLFLKIA